MSDSQETRDREARHPIGVIASRTGLPQDVLRAWERRYEAVVPVRTDTGRRLYTDRDLEKLRLLKAAVEQGRRISDVASLDMRDLRELVEEDFASAVNAGGARASGKPTQEGAAYVQLALDATLALDSERLRTILADASVALTAPAMRTEVLLPLMHEIGEKWRVGELRIAHEHLATAIVRSFLGVNGRPISRNAPVVVVTTPSGQGHELGALIAASAASEIGWNALYLGPNLPAQEIAAVVRAKNASAIALSIISPADDPHLPAELQEIRRLVGDDVKILIGGASAGSYVATINAIGAHIADDISEFQGHLSATRR